MADADCTNCPIQVFKEQSIGHQTGAEKITLAPLDPRCQQVTNCLSDVFIVPPGKPVTTDYPQANVTLFENGKQQAFASCLVIWQACHLMTQRPYHRWQPVNGFITYEYHSQAGRLIYRLPHRYWEQDDVDIRVILIHLLFAACATQKVQPWADPVVIHDRIIAEFLGLHQRKDINRLKKLLLIESLVRQACTLEVEIFWQKRGQIPPVHLSFAPLWSAKPLYHIAKAKDGSPYLSGLSFQVVAGPWSTYFLNRQQARQTSAYYQYGWLPISFAPQIMHLWQRHPGCVVMLLYLLFRRRVSQECSTKVGTLLKLIYGEDYLQRAWHQSEVRRRVMATFESDLEQLFQYGFRPLFADDTYPPSIQPWWFTTRDIPDDPDAALDYWAEKARATPLTNNSRKKWSQLLNAWVSLTEFPEDWRTENAQGIARSKPRVSAQATSAITGAMIKQARLQRGMSQRQLSALLHKSQSWIRDIESGRYKIKPKDIALLASVLGDFTSALGNRVNHSQPDL
ncbi:MAG: helix-turn-helix transcriptional regulator [Gloeomargarita sp. SKYG116]|nr:helix-turn-helix transcriptional regulator [Gloeomargarita sp. SKYG116]MDW8400825.1 helix-turn-helix transcriptional regulator [Gloeomargarita sp. SKYGB_i_bin116]